ncbi:ER membrane protein complex subunit 1 [Euphorbia peplus]|nr:ER membrane protein complex subunit 1 [Euphorbia peplus]
MATRVCVVCLFVLSCVITTAFSLYEDQVGLMDWHQQYIGKVKDAVFHTQKTGRKRVVVSTEENLIASLDLRHGEIFWRHLLGPNDPIDGIQIAMGKYVVTLSSEGSIVRAWNLPDGQMVWESYLQGPYHSKSFFLVPESSRPDKDNMILVLGKGCLHALSSIHGEVLWKKEFADESFEVQQVVHPIGSDIIHVVGFVGLFQLDVYKIDAKNGELLKHESAKSSSGFSGEVSLVSSGALVVLDSTGTTVTTVNFLNGQISFQKTYISDLIEDFSGNAMILPSKIAGMFTLKSDTITVFTRVTSEGKLEVIDKVNHVTAISNALSLSDGQEAYALVEHRGNDIYLTVKLGQDKDSDLLRQIIKMDQPRGTVHKQGEIVWSREDGLASIVDVTTSELRVEKKGVSVAKVEENLFEWLKGHFLKLKGTLMLASPEEVVAIQAMRLKSSEKSKLTRDHNGFRKLLIVLTKSGKVFALHTGDGSVVWSLLLKSLRKSEACENPTALNVYQWQVPHHHAMDENPSVLVVGRCGPSVGAPDAQRQAYLYPKTAEAVDIFQHEFSNIYWYSVEADNGVIRGHALKGHCIGGAAEEFCFETRNIWSIVFPLESEKIITAVTRKSNEVVHTQAKVIADQDVMYKYISKNLLFVATVAPKAIGGIGSATPEESSLVAYVIDTITGRILHRVTHHGAHGPVHAVFSENWVVYHYFNLRAHRNEMSVIEIYDQSRADNKDVWKLVLGKHNLTSRVSSYSRPEIVTKSQSYFFTHSVKAIAVTTTAKGITSKQLLIGTIGDQILALDKRFVDPRRSLNPSQAEKEEGILPLTDALPIIPQSYVTHALQVEGLRGIVTVAAKLESNTLVFAYGVDLFFTRLAPSRTYDSLTEDFSYALLLITIVALVVAIFVTWVLSEKKELRDKWR